MTTVEEPTLETPVMDLRPGEDGVGPEADLDVPRSRSRLDRSALGDVLLALVAAGAVAGILRAALDWHGYLSTGLWAYGAFVVCLFALARDGASAERAVDRLVTVLIWSGALVVIAVLVWMLAYLVSRGAPTMGFSFFTEDLSKVGPLDPGGGAKAAIVGSAEQVGIATVVTVPLAVLTAVYLHELKGRLAPLIRFIVDALSGLPSIVAGLLLFTLWVVNHGFSGAAGAVSLIVLMLPTVTRTSEEILKTIPDPLREASLALGAPQWRVVLRVVVPTAVSGLVTGVILGIARAVGETAPMLLTVSGSNFTNYNPFKGPQSDLPVFIFGLIREPNRLQNDRGWTAALILVILVLILFVAARFVLARSQKKLRRSR